MEAVLKKEIISNKILCRMIGVFVFVILIILCSGIIWLKILLGYTWAKLLFIGFIPFIPGDLLKAFVASNLYLKLNSRLKEVF